MASYFNKSILANGLSSLSNYYGSWVLIGDNVAYKDCSFEGKDGETISASPDGDDKKVASSITISDTALNLTDFKDINIAAMTNPVSLNDKTNASYVWGDNDGSSGTTVLNNKLFKNELKLKIKGQRANAESTSDNSCFAAPGANTSGNTNKCGFKLKTIWYVIFESTNGSFPSNFNSIKKCYGGTSYWTSSESINSTSNSLISSSKMVLFGTDAASGDTNLFNDYNYTSFSVGDLEITLKGLA